jgi:hypothetical protein
MIQPERKVITSRAALSIFSGQWLAAAGVARFARKRAADNSAILANRATSASHQIEF